MLVETCIRKGLGLKAHRVMAVREEEAGFVAELERFGRRRLRCSGCGIESRRTAGRQGVRRWRDRVRRRRTDHRTGHRTRHYPRAPRRRKDPRG